VRQLSRQPLGGASECNLIKQHKENTMVQYLRTLFLAILCLLFGLTTVSQAQDQSAKWEPFVKAVQDVLAGRPIDNKNITISPEAYLVFGSQYQLLRAVVAGEFKTCSLKEEPTRVVVFINMKISDSENVAFMTLKTQTDKKTDDRFHTVIFMKDSVANWNIQTWHTSN
jgi:hypothetical protein